MAAGIRSSDEEYPGCLLCQSLSASVKWAPCACSGWDGLLHAQQSHGHGLTNKQVMKGWRLRCRLHPPPQELAVCGA